MLLLQFHLVQRLYRALQKVALEKKILLIFNNYIDLLYKILHTSYPLVAIFIALCIESRKLRCF